MSASTQVIFLSGTTRASIRQAANGLIRDLRAEGAHGDEATEEAMVRLAEAVLAASRDDLKDQIRALESDVDDLESEILRLKSAPKSNESRP